MGRRGKSMGAALKLLLVEIQVLANLPSVAALREVMGPDGWEQSGLSEMHKYMLRVEKP